MEQVVRKAYAKINLGLDVIRRRPDGYHEVKMIMQTVNLYDELLFKKETEPGIRIVTECAEIPTDQNNLIYKAAAAVMERYPQPVGVTITLKKQIPIAAGMAGGSTDGAAVFHGLNELFELSMTVEEMCEMGVKIGADVPYCIIGGTALSEGIGEKLTPLPVPPECYVLIVKPAISVSTKFVYENLHADKLKYHPDIEGMVKALWEKDLSGITERMENVLETVTIKEYPVIREIKVQMLALGAENALMSGSGPTVFGIFAEKEQAKQAYGKLKQMRTEKEIFLTTFV